MSDQIWTLVLQSSLMLAMAQLVTLLLRGKSAALRHLVWTLALGLVLVVPLLEWLWPESPVDGLLPLAVALEPTRIVVRADDPGRGLGPWWVWAWGCGMVALLLREGLAQVRAEWLRRRAVNGISRDLAVPVVCGLWRPVVLLPDSARQWPEERLAAVLAHEQMHVLRGDLWWQLLGRVACAVYWPHPLVWLAARAQQRECEQACDDGVLQAGVPAVDYAGHLLAIAQNLKPERYLEGGLSMAQRSTLEQRLRALLDPLTSHQPLSRGMVAVSVLSTCALLLPVLGLKLIAQVSGEVRGVVVSADGAPVADARVTLRFLKPELNNRMELTRTNAEGVFTFPALPEDLYAIFVEKRGYAVLSNTMVKLGGSRAANLRFVLNDGGMGESLPMSGLIPPPPPPPLPPGTPQVQSASRIRVGGGVQASKLLQRVPPVYPEDCKRQGVQGIVMLAAVIGKEGEVLSIEPTNQFVDPRLKESAMAAVKLWRYQPTLLNGNPVEVTTQIEVNFTLMP